MATAKQVAANQANAKRSTGPKTDAGKARSKRNAFKHGLSCGLPVTSEPLPHIKALQDALVGEDAGEEQQLVAAEFACAQYQLLQIRGLRARQFAELPSDIDDEALPLLRGIAALDRYERYALTKRRRAAQKLEGNQS